MAAPAPLTPSSPYAPFKVADWMRPRSQRPAPHQCAVVDGASAAAGGPSTTLGRSERWSCWVQGDLFATSPGVVLPIAALHGR